MSNKTTSDISTLNKFEIRVKFLLIRTYLLIISVELGACGVIKRNFKIPYRI